MQSKQTETATSAQDAVPPNVTKQLDPQVALIADLSRKLAIAEAALELYGLYSNWEPGSDHDGEDAWLWTRKGYDVEPHEIAKGALAKIQPAKNESCNL